MEFFRWKSDYSVRIDIIDEQHKKLLALINELYTAFTNKTDTVVMQKILDSLIDYTNYHFGTEEKLFKESGYLLENEHIQLHKKFVEQLTGFLEEFKSGKLFVTSRLMNFLRNWLINHIQKEDQKYSIHISEYLKTINS